MNEQKKENRFIKYFKKVLKFCENLLFPNCKCLFCGRDVPNFEEKPYCDECEKELSFNRKSKCLICSEPIENDAVVCDNCQKHKRNFKKAFCPFVYDGLVRKSILGYKDSNQRYKAETFAKFIVDEIEKENIKFDLITFVPLTKKKEKQRSFNQSKLLAEEIGKLLGVEVISVFRKDKDDVSQKFSTFKERQENMIGLYSVMENVKLKKTQSVLIVDDVITTCATVNYCSGLVSKKVKEVYVCAIARNKLRRKQDYHETKKEE